MQIFLAGGESRHWVHSPLIEETNESISCGRVLQKHGQRNQADCMGGIVPEVINESVPCKSTHDSEIPKRATNGDFPIRGDIPDKAEINENIHSRHSSMWGG